MQSLSNRLRGKSQNHNQTKKEKTNGDWQQLRTRSFVLSVFHPSVCNRETINIFGSPKLSGLFRPLFMWAEYTAQLLFIHRRLCFCKLLNNKTRSRVLLKFRTKWRNPHFMIDNNKERLENRKKTRQSREKRKTLIQWKMILHSLIISLSLSCPLYNYGGHWFLEWQSIDVLFSERRLSVDCVAYELLNTEWSVALPFAGICW